MVKMDDVCVEELSESFTPREYQIEILDEAKQNNTIACLGTGTGKTFIAVLLIKEMAAEVQIPFEKGGKKIFFLVPTVPLVHQQARVISNHTELTVGEYFGEMNVDAWSVDEWKEQFREKEVLVMTGEICRIILDHCFLPVSKICLLIFDECHRTCGNHPYAEIMRHISSCSSEDIPKIFGLTASLLNGKAKLSNLEKKLRCLEASLSSKIVTASDYDEVMKYGTDPEEIIVLYKIASEDNYESVLADLNQIATEWKDLSNNDIHSPSKDGNSISFFIKPSHSIKQIIKLHRELGPWCACCASEVVSTEIDKYLCRLTDEDIVKLLQKTKDVLTSYISQFGKVQCDDISNLSHKLNRFLDIFRALQECEFSTNSSEFDNLNEDSLKMEEMPISIVFVEERIVAYVLCKWISEISAKSEEFRRVKPEFIVGHGTVGWALGSKNSQMSVKLQQKIVKRFRDKEFNILIATSVLEEGMDIQKCNVVIRFDIPKDFRSYVQSKGRARAHSSKYILLVPEYQQDEIMEDLCTFKTIENFLLRKCHGRKLPDDDMKEIYLSQHLIPPYQPLTAEGSPRVTLCSAISLVNRYCAKLPSDMACKLTPRWKVELTDPDDPLGSYTCTLHMPINSSLRQPVVGQAMKRKKLAKMAAALKACELLHKLGELNDYLLPVRASVDAEAKKLGALDEEATEDGLQPGTKRKKRLHKKKVADILNNNIPSSGELCYLHVVVMQLVVPLAKSLNPRKRPLHDPADFPQDFALLTRKKLPKVPQFPIFTKVGKIQVSVFCINNHISISAEQLKSLEVFHQFLFDQTLCLVTHEMLFEPFSSDFSTLIVPVIKESSQYTLDWKFIEYTINHDYNLQIRKSISEKERLTFDDHLFKNAIVTRIYHRKDSTKHNKFYLVKNIANDMSPCSPFSDNKHVNFKDFYQYKYGIHIKTDDQPLLDVEPCSSISFIKPIYTKIGQQHIDSYENVSSSKQKHAAFREYFIPELCLVHPFPSALFLKASYLPSIFFRLNCLLLAEEIRCSVAMSQNIGTVALEEDFHWPTFNFERSDRDLRSALIKTGEIIKEEYHPLVACADINKLENNEIASFEVKSDVSRVLGPSSGSLLMALTTTSAADEFDLERLETIGDSFLKYAISVKIYVSYSKLDEGNLTILRSKLICNHNLYQLATKKCLSQCLVHRPFNLKLGWLPPCYNIEENVSVENTRVDKKLYTKVFKTDSTGRKEKMDFLYTKQLIPDKCIADSVEALIGVYLLHCGQEGALRFMSWLGFSLFLEDGNEIGDFKSWPPKAKGPFIDESIDVDSALVKMNLSQEFKRFQERIGYEFNEIGYLLQAFTHASYYYNEITDCYQRLEFLGDAVLDYLITRKLFDDPKEHDPGKLTDLRSALVNNIYFASLAVKYGYHKNLRCLSITLQKLIDEFIAELEETDAYKMFQNYGYYLEEVECFELEEVEVPKALGDLFESVAGAIYLDSGLSLDTVWNVYYPMMKPAIDHLSHDVPKSPVRELLENVNDKDIFKDIEGAAGKIRVQVTLPSGKKFIGSGPSRRVAKRSAAKQAVRYLKFGS